METWAVPVLALRLKPVSLGASATGYDLNAKDHLNNYSTAYVPA